MHTENRWAETPHPTPKIEQRKRAKSSTTQLWIRFLSNFDQSLSTWQSKCQGQEIKSQGHSADIACAKIHKIINNSAMDC